MSEEGRALARAGEFDAVVFDCDGVLVDSEAITCAVIAGMITELGAPLSAQEALRWFAGSRVLDHREAIEARIGAALPADFHPRFIERRNAALAHSVEAMPGAREAVESVRALGLPFAVASGADSNKLRLMLGRVGLLAHFDGSMDRDSRIAGMGGGRSRVFGSDMVERAKPFPDVYELACRSIGVPPARTLVIEDSPTGTRAGRSAGATVIGLATLFTADALRAAGAEGTVASMHEVAELLRAAPPSR